MNEPSRSGISELLSNIKSLKGTIAGSFLRGGMPVSDRSRTAVVVNNFFLHIQGAKTHLNSLRPGYTLGLGLISLFLFVITVVSGALLMVYYRPSVLEAYDSIKEINYVVFGGKLLRNTHKWAGEGMILSALLHMGRVFYTSAYKKGREFNWVIGIVLLALVFVINFTGYLLPWDQLSYWALIIGSNIAQSLKEVADIVGIAALADIAGFPKELLLGGSTPGAATIPRIYFLHVMLLPFLLSLLIGVHFWRIRKDGGLTVPEDFSADRRKSVSDSSLSREDSPFAPGKTYGLMAIVQGKSPAVSSNDVENSVNSWPHLLRAETAVFMLTLMGVVVYSYYFDAPIKEIANALIPENPAKAPWYFLGLQELVSYSAFMGGIVMPSLTLLSLALIPYLDREPGHVGIWFSGRRGGMVTLWSCLVGGCALVGMLAFVINNGWFRSWWPDIPQLVIILVNPGTIWMGFVAIFSFLVIYKTGSTRMGAIALFSLFLVSYLIFTYVGTELRGPNWEFYWSKSQWPIH